MEMQEVITLALELANALEEAAEYDGADLGVTDSALCALALRAFVQSSGIAGGVAVAQAA